MKIARLLLAASALLAAAACSRGAPTAPVELDLEKHRNNIGQFGSGTLTSDPPVPTDPTTSLGT